MFLWCDLENVGGQLVQRFARMDPKDLLPHEWDARIGMKGTLASRFLYLTLLGDESLKPSPPTAINNFVKEQMDWLVDAHMDAFYGLATIIRLHCHNHPELALGEQTMPFDEDMAGMREPGK
jgi:hypothetical protein